MVITAEELKIFVARYQQNDKMYLIDIEAESNEEADAILKSIKAIRQYQPVKE